MMKYLGCCMIFLSCSAQFVRQPPVILLTEMPVGCEPLHQLVRDKWIKHARHNYHVVFNELYTVPHFYGPCLLKMNKSAIEQLFGAPDIEQANRFEYVFRRVSGKIKSYEYSSLLISFSGDLVSKAEIEWHDAIE